MYILRRIVVGMTGFEPATTRSQSDHSTRLNYIPMLVGRVGFEPTMFTYKDRIYSPAQNHRPCSLPMF